MGLVKGKLKDTLPDEKVQKIVSQTYFKPEEVQVLYQIFKTISAKNQDDGVIDMKEFQMAMGFENSDIARRIFKVFDKNGDKVISFKEFCQGLSVYTSKAPLEEKLQFSFKLYDMDNDGYIDKNELFEMLRASLFENFMLELSEAQMRKLVDSTFDEVDTNGDGKISFEEYKQMITSNPEMLASFQVKFVEGDEDDIEEDSDESDDSADSDSRRKNSLDLSSSGKGRSRASSLSSDKRKPKSRDSSPLKDKQEKSPRHSSDEKSTKVEGLPKRSSKLRLSPKSEKTQSQVSSADRKSNEEKSSTHSVMTTSRSPPFKKRTSLEETKVKNNDNNKSKLKASGKGEKQREVKVDNSDKIESTKRSLATSLTFMRPSKLNKDEFSSPSNEQPKVITEGDVVAKRKGSSSQRSQPSFRYLHDKEKETKKDESQERDTATKSSTPTRSLAMSQLVSSSTHLKRKDKQTKRRHSIEDERQEDSSRNEFIDQ